jgi:hypothetical protein
MWGALRLGPLHEELRNTDATYVELERKMKDFDSSRRNDNGIRVDSRAKPLTAKSGKHEERREEADFALQDGKTKTKDAPLPRLLGSPPIKSLFEYLV